MLTRRHFLITTTALFSAPIATAQDAEDETAVEAPVGTLSETDAAEAPAPTPPRPTSNPSNWNSWDARVTPANYDPATSNPWGLPSRFLPKRVEANPGLTPGDIHVDAIARYLYHIQGDGTAMRYGVAIAKGNLYEPGVYRIGRKAKWPTWTPTAAMVRRDPGTYKRHKNGMNGGPSNPLGSRAFYLYTGNRDTYLRIHGSPAPRSIGGRASSGCVRMVMAHIIDLYPNVAVGSTAHLHPPEDMIAARS
ncbi:L,D-transpeptidase [Maritimibacter dapengensis]|uniref:L,D-transpeptidase n=1 Tax=Maritimibacter dapengensis TaxID=2836868 RepID=A0ABS6T5N3_9RHOB|nr:L,D-transpeptidase [Maritimibacter dapengensis]MBV7380524.1 L,D-transpeptidase [Maritimibacter dapengensis]